MKNHYQHLLSGQFEQDAMKEIDKLLSEELAKPEQNRDYDLIEELTDTYSSLSGMDEQIDKAAEQGIAVLNEKMHNTPKPHLTRRIKMIATVACAALVLLVANALTVSAFDMNLFSFIVNIIDGGFSIDSPLPSGEIPASDIIELSATPDDPYGMIAECAKYGIYPETPHYLPDDYVLTLCSYTDMPSFSKDMRFTFTNRHNVKQVIMFRYSLYENSESMAGVGFSNVEHHLSEIEINGKPAILAEEKKDKQFTVVYPIDNLLINMFTQDVPKEDVNQIISSIK